MPLVLGIFLCLELFEEIIFRLVGLGVDYLTELILRKMLFSIESYDV